MVFTQGYAGAGNCAPSRAVLLAGQYTPRHAVYAVNSTQRGPQPLMRMIPVPNRSGLPVATVTLADALGSAGYATDLLAWIERIGAPLPVERNPAYAPDTWPSDKRVRR